MRTIILFIIMTLTIGCVEYSPKPVSPVDAALSFESRTLDAPSLKEFLEKNLRREVSSWPPREWDFEMLTLAAFYYSPDMDVARAKWGVARAGVITAGGRPNPGIGFTPQYNADTAGGLSPWTLGFNLDIPMETAGKRGYRIAQAQHLSEAARLNIASVAWQVRSRLRRSLLDLYAANERETLLERQLAVQGEIVKLLQQRLTYGEISQIELTRAHISLDQTNLSLKEIQRQIAENRVRLAESLGLPVNALEKINISFDLLKQMPTDIPLQDVRHQALLNRPDILAALSEYAAVESSLQLEIARQYPDIHLGPGYSWDQGANKWSIGFSISLPILNQNQGPIAEADARRKEAESRLTAIQSGIIGEIDRAFAGYSSALKKLETADSLLSTQEKQSQSIQAMFNAGEADRLMLLDNKLEIYSTALMRLDAFVDAQRLLGLIEDAVQRPLEPLKLFLNVPEMNSHTKEEDK